MWTIRQSGHSSRRNGTRQMLEGVFSAPHGPARAQRLPLEGRGHEMPRGGQQRRPVGEVTTAAQQAHHRLQRRVVFGEHVAGQRVLLSEFAARQATDLAAHEVLEPGQRHRRTGDGKIVGQRADQVGKTVLLDQELGFERHRVDVAVTVQRVQGDRRARSSKPADKDAVHASASCRPSTPSRSARSGRYGCSGGGASGRVPSAASWRANRALAWCAPVMLLTRPRLGPPVALVEQTCGLALQRVERRPGTRRRVDEVARPPQAVDGVVVRQDRQPRRHRVHQRLAARLRQRRQIQVDLQSRDDLAEPRHVADMDERSRAAGRRRQADRAGRSASRRRAGRRGSAPRP